MEISIDGVGYYAYTASRPANPDSETVLFVHGTAMDHTVWALQSRYFAYHGYNILALDLPGHGLSGGDPLDSIGAYADWLIAVAGQAEGTRLHLVGHSMGALIALQAAAQLPADRLASLSLVGFSYPMTVSPQLLDAAQNRPDAAFAMMTQWSHTSPIGGEPNPGFWSAGSQMSLMSNSRPGAVFTDLTACNEYADAESAFNGIDCPILFISGTLDRMAPSKLAKKQADSAANASIVMLSDCGHSIMSENPDGVRDALRSFISRPGVSDD